MPGAPLQRPPAPAWPPAIGSVSILWSAESIRLRRAGLSQDCASSAGPEQRQPETDQPCYINNILTPGCVN